MDLNPQPSCLRENTLPQGHCGNSFFTWLNQQNKALNIFIYRKKDL